jgi:hypothetical protein
MTFSGFRNEFFRIRILLKVFGSTVSGSTTLSNCNRVWKLAVWVPNANFPIISNPAADSTLRVQIMCKIVKNFRVYLMCETRF